MSDQRESAQILLDIDGCFANFNESFRLLLNQKGADISQSFAAAHPPLWDWPTEMTSPALVREAWDEVRAHPDWWATLAPLSEVTPKVRQLLRDLSLERNVIFATARPGNDLWRLKQITARWISDHVGTIHPTVLLTPRPKALVAGVLHATHLVEDNPEAFPGPVLPRSFLIDRTYNVNVRVPPAVNRVPSLEHALEQIVKEVLG